MTKSRLITSLLIAGLVVMIGASFLEWREGSMRMIGDAIQWIVLVGMLVAARSVISRLNRSEARLRALVHSINELILVLDQDGRYIEVVSTNQGPRYRPEVGRIGKTIHEVLPREMAERVQAGIRFALEKGTPMEVDVQLDDAWFSVSVAPLTPTTVLCVGRDITARKMTEAQLEARVVDRTRALTQSEERYRSVFDQAEEIIFTISRDGIVTSLNPAFERATGWRREEWVGKHFMALMPADMHERAMILFATLLQSGRLEGSRIDVLGARGRRLTCEFSIGEQVLQGRSVGFLGVARDVTQRERALEQLRQRERQLAEAQRVANLGSWERDLVTNDVWWSDELFRILDVERTDHPPNTKFRELVIPEDRHLLDKALEAILVSGGHEWQVTVRLANGTEKVLQCKATLVRQSDMRPRTVGTVQDVTEKIRAERLLRDGEERFRLIIEATNDIVWDWKVDSQTIWRSAVFEERFGQPSGESNASVHNLLDLVHPDDRQAVKDSLIEALESGLSSWSFEYRLRRADGTYANILDRAYIARDPSKRAIRVLGAMMDVTEQKLLIEQLEQAKRVSSLGRVAASIAHEFNNILMGIQPNIEVIRRSSPSGLRAVTENIAHAVQRGKRVTDEILRFTRPAEPNLQCLNVGDFVTRWREEIETLLPAPVDLVIETPSDPLYCSADPMQIAQIFTNLALNARDAMGENGGRLTVTAHLSNSFGTFPFGVIKTPDRFVHFSVSDEGCGISPDRLAHIFEPLFTTKRGGVGLGLAITYQIVTRHGGHIFVESEVGRGSTFHVFLPAALPAIEEVRPQTGPRIGSIRKLLLVEDEPAVASGLAMLFEMEGISVRTVHTGRESIPAIEEFEPDGVILDIGLPDIDGVGLYNEIDRRWPGLPVLFSSGHGDSAKLESYLARPHVGFILKPYEFDAMRDALSQLIAKSA